MKSEHLQSLESPVVLFSNLHTNCFSDSKSLNPVPVWTKTVRWTINWTLGTNVPDSLTFYLSLYLIIIITIMALRGSSICSMQVLEIFWSTSFSWTCQFCLWADTVPLQGLTSMQKIPWPSWKQQNTTLNSQCRWSNALSNSSHAIATFRELIGEKLR